jgi:hypothetical protein
MIYVNQKMMKPILLLACMTLLYMGTLAQTRTVIATAAWNVGTTWQSGNIADVIGEDVVFATGSGELTASIPGGYTPTVGNVDLGTTGNISIAGSLNIGNSVTTKNLSGTSDERTITVSGNLVIWGNVVFTGKVNWFVSGTVLIKGNLTMGNSSYISGSGTFTVNGNFTSGTSTLVQNSNIVKVVGAVSVGASSILQNSGTFTAQSCSGPASFCGGVLPIVLKNFQGDAGPEEVALTWITTTEYNFDRFVIERSINGVNYTEIGVVYGAGRNLKDIETTYFFSDANPQIGRNYYRLRCVDLDLFEEFSPVIMVDWKGNNIISVYPIPGDGNSMVIKTNFDPDENASVTIHNNVGAALYVFPVHGTESNLQFTSKLPTGIYYLHYSSRNQQKVFRIPVK